MVTRNRTTVYLDASVHRALKVKSAETRTPVSDLVERAVRLALAEDAIDLEAFDARAKESARPFERVLREMKRDGLL